MGCDLGRGFAAKPLPRSQPHHLQSLCPLLGIIKFKNRPTGISTKAETWHPHKKYRTYVNKAIFARQWWHWLHNNYQPASVFPISVSFVQVSLLLLLYISSIHIDACGSWEHRQWKRLGQVGRVLSCPFPGLPTLVPHLNITYNIKCSLHSHYNILTLWKWHCVLRVGWRELSFHLRNRGWPLMS